MNALTIISLLLFVCFVAISIVKFGLLPSWSAYGLKWAQSHPIPNLNIWSAINIIVALLLIPPMIERGIDNPWQFLGFFAPLYLIVVGLTPNFDKVDGKWTKEGLVHTFGAFGCAIMSTLWMAYEWWVILITAGVMLLLALTTNSLRESIVFWAEMALFPAAYAVLLLF
jgi:hypothetical protein